MLKDIPVVEQRYQAVLAVLEDGLTVTEVAEQMQGSRYADGGLDALADRSHRPRSCPHQTDADVAVRLTELRQLHPTWGPDRLLYRLERQGLDPLPSRAARSPDGKANTRPTSPYTESPSCRGSKGNRCGRSRRPAARWLLLGWSAGPCDLEILAERGDHCDRRASPTITLRVWSTRSPTGASCPRWLPPVTARR